MISNVQVVILDNEEFNKENKMINICSNRTVCYGNGYGDGHGNGTGNGRGYGYGYGLGSGDGSGDGNGDRCINGPFNANGHGEGDGNRYEINPDKYLTNIFA